MNDVNKPYTKHTKNTKDNTMSNFATLKKSTMSLDRLAKEIEKMNAPATQERNTEDTRFWKLERDKSGNGSAVIRFLPSAAVDGDDSLPWVRVFDHGFKGPTGKWYIEKSLTTLNQKDPVSEYNTKLWNESSDDNSPQRKQARAQKRRLQYISNILVVSDPKNPENEGKVFLFKYGKKIFDKITLLTNPQFDGDDPINPFDFWRGANFKIRIRTVDGYPNYDQSVFAEPSAVSDNDSELEKIWKSQHSLKEFVAPSSFKSYEDLKKRLDEVLGLDASAETMRRESVARTSSSVRTTVSDSIMTLDDDDDDLEAFKALAQ